MQEVGEIEIFGGVALSHAVGARHFLLSSDLGQKMNPLHTDGLRAFIEGLHQGGVGDADIDLMIKRNPARLLGLDP